MRQNKKQSMILNDKIKLSPYAKLFYIEWLLSPQSYRYNVTFAQRLFGNMDEQRLKGALKRYVEEHLLLNSHVQEINGEEFWIKNDAIWELEYFSEPLDDVALLNYVMEPFEIQRGPLYRFRLIRLNEKTYQFFVVLHHLVMDGSCLDDGVFDAISHYYNDETHTAKYTIQEQIRLNENFCHGVLAQLAENSEASRKFWQSQLAEVENLDLGFLKQPTAYKNSENRVNPIEEIKFSFTDDNLAKIHTLKSRYSISPYIYGQCILAMLLYRYTGQKSFVMTYPVAIKAGIDFIYGAQLTISMLPYHFHEAMTISELLETCKNFFAHVKENDYYYYPITDLFNDSTLSLDKRLLNISFIQAPFREKGFQFNGIEAVEILSRFNVDSVPNDMLLFEQEKQHEHQLNYRVRYDTRTFDSVLLTSFIDVYKKIFLSVLNDLLEGNHEKKIITYRLLDDKCYDHFVNVWQHVRTYPDNKTIHARFEEQVEKTPHNIAITYQSRFLTYRQLNEQSNQLAHYIQRSYRVKTDRMIALSLERSEYWIIAILAVLKAGCAYVPIDPFYPEDRIHYILEDTKAAVIITQARYLNYLEKKHENVLAIDTLLLNKTLSQELTCNPVSDASGDNLAYVIYTSGTTGKPKGVLQPHHNVERLFLATDNWYHFNEQDTWLLFHAYVFDFTVWEIWGALFYGGKLVIPTIEQIRDPALYYELCYREKVTVLNQTPQAFYGFIDVAVDRKGAQYLSSLRYIIFGGDKLEYKHLKPWIEIYGDANPILINMYGITETTVHVTYKVIKKDSLGNSSCIGQPIPDQYLYVLDNFLLPVPIGVIGELFVGGAGLARGYLNQSQLTQERFIKDPFIEYMTEADAARNKAKNSSAKCIYKTNDRVRWLANGDLEYIGRNDGQVKIRGYRIELREIEQTLLHHPCIKQTIVVEKNQNDDDNCSYLVAYYIAKKTLNDTEIRNYLLTQLPEHMCPNVFIGLKQFPLNRNGKVDIKALPEALVKKQGEYKAPHNSSESIICDAFSRVLDVKRVGLTDDFFALGGNSLSAIRLVSLLQHSFLINVAAVFHLRTPQNMANELSRDQDVLRKTLEHIKQMYHSHKGYEMNEAIINRLTAYLSGHYASNINTAKKSIKHVLLTGATGYLGCYILHELLNSTRYTVFLLVRANSLQKAMQRINQKYQFYFGKSLDLLFEKRLFIIKADIEKKLLGLTAIQYQYWVEKIDSVIHAAALVKHYGEEKVFYSANVKATINLLEFSKLTRLKDFHYISTISVLNFGVTSGNGDNIFFTEDNAPALLEDSHNIYVKTKLMGEREVVKYRQYGINSNIYRIGNLAFSSDGMKTQENIQENAFYNWVKCLLHMECLAEEIAFVEISPVDLTANAIVKLFDKDSLKNGLYHVFNPYGVNLIEVFKYQHDILMKTLSMEKFINHILVYLQESDWHEFILRFLLHQGWLEGKKEQYFIFENVFQDRTQQILKQLDFEWLPISEIVFRNYLDLIRTF
jgi:surfactin family lipopeptide synthetase A